MYVEAIIHLYDILPFHLTINIEFCYIFYGSSCGHLQQRFAPADFFGAKEGEMAVILVVDQDRGSSELLCDCIYQYLDMPEMVVIEYDSAEAMRALEERAFKLAAIITDLYPGGGVLGSGHALPLPRAG